MVSNDEGLFPFDEQKNCSDDKRAEGENADLRFVSIERICSEN